MGDGSNAKGPFVWVVSGLPRSGTSMVMQMLEAAGLPLLTDETRAADADNPRGYFEFEAVKGLPRDGRFLADAVGRGVKIVAPLLRFLPPSHRYAVILVERAMPAVLESQRLMMERSAEESAADTPKVSAREERALAKAFERSLAQAKDQLAASAPDRMIVLRHEDVVASPIDAARRVLDFLERHDAPLDVRVGQGERSPERDALLEGMAAVVDASLCHHT